MDRSDLGFVVLAILGIALVWTAPAEPIYSLGISEAPDAAPEEETRFVNLDTDAQLEFLDTLQNDRWSGSESPALSNGYVRYKGELYRVDVSVSESSIGSLLQPVVGGGIAIIGIFGLIGRRLWRRFS